MAEEHTDKFSEYYREASLSPEAFERFSSIREVVQGVIAANQYDRTILDVADIGCGAGTQSMLWARDGHRVEGIDINEPLLDIARQRADQDGQTIVYHLGSAEKLPWPDESKDVCLVPELLEHVPDWQKCLSEFDRILRPGGVMYLSTNNVLCPVQQEFDLPLYSWYPSILKRHYEHLAVTTRPDLVNHAEYPAIHWFSFYGLREALDKRGYEVADRFDTVRLERKGLLTSAVIGAIRKLPPLRFAAHVCTPYTAVIATKRHSNTEGQSS